MPKRRGSCLVLTSVVSKACRKSKIRGASVPQNFSKPAIRQPQTAHQTPAPAGAEDNGPGRKSGRSPKVRTEKDSGPPLASRINRPHAHTSGTCLWARARCHTSLSVPNQFANFLLVWFQRDHEDGTERTIPTMLQALFCKS
jgi:hypothetical protein